MKIFAVCDTCKLKHPVKPCSNEFLEFVARHPHHATRQAALWNPFSWLYEKMFEHQIGWLAYAPNANIKAAFGTDTSITCTLASLASSSSAGRESTAIDNTSNLYLDALVRFHCKLQTGTPANDKTTYIYAYGSEDGTNYTDNATGTDAALTFRSPTNLRLIGTIAMPDSGALTYKSHPLSVAAAFGGILPPKWGTAVLNFSGVAFDATEGNHAKAYNGVYATSI